MATTQLGASVLRRLPCKAQKEDPDAAKFSQCERARCGLFEANYPVWQLHGSEQAGLPVLQLLYAFHQANIFAKLRVGR